MKDLKNNLSTMKIGVCGCGNDMNKKLAILANSQTIKTFEDGYVVAFIHPMTHQPIFLANCADIMSICYSNDPKLPGTTNIKYAKVYPNIESAKEDIYLLRYHHRQFLKVLAVAKQVIHFHAELEFSEEQILLYSPSELMLNDNSNPFEN